MKSGPDISLPDSFISGKGLAGVGHNHLSIFNDVAPTGEIHGFLVNRVLSAVQREALFLYDTGVASFEDIDLAVMEGLGHKIPPFRLMDLIGLDLVQLISNEHYSETGDPVFKPSPAIVEKVTLNRLGRKTGRGFYGYTEMLAQRGYGGYYCMVPFCR